MTTPEERTGIARDRTNHTARQGMLYSLEMQRPYWSAARRICLLTEVDLPAGEQAPVGIVPLGGEGRSACLHALPNAPAAIAALLTGQDREAIRSAIAREGRFRLYLLTPAVLKSGWLPAFFAGGNAMLPSVLNGAATGKPIPVAGWDLAHRAPKPLRLAVPAGSVFFGTLNDSGQASALMDRFHFQTALQADEAVPLNRATSSRADYLAACGFGLTLVGAWRSE